jgi:sulfoxide reductase heme-binding subunit YedZ
VKSSQWMKRVIKPSVFVLSLLPFGLLLYNFFTDNLSANPLDDITDTTGTWTLRFLMITLSVTPLVKITGWGILSQLRRMCGLYAFFYGSMHFLTYLWFDKFFEWEEILPDIPKRPFILVGFTSLMLMVPLALTSWNRMVKRLGGKRWKRLHRLVYLVAIGGVLHYLWLVKADITRPMTYGALLAVLLGYRIWLYFAARSANAKPVFQEDTSPAS